MFRDFLLKIICENTFFPQNKTIEPTCGKIVYISNGFSHMDFGMSIKLMKILNYSISQNTEVGTWNSGLNNSIAIRRKKLLKSFTSFTTFRIVVAEVNNLRITYRKYIDIWVDDTFQFYN